MASINSEYTNLQHNFSRNLYMTLAQNGDGNIFFSPFSIATILAIAYIGSNASTEEQIKEVLQFPDKESLQKVYSIYLKSLKEGNTEYELRTSNVAYLAKDFKILKDFQTSMLQHFHAALKTVDFSQSDAVTKEINELVEKETNSKIKNLIPNGLLNGLTRMVLINAIYFKGLWKTQFKSQFTRDKNFWISATESVKVPTMFMEDKFEHKVLNDLDARMLTMRYKGDKISMQFLLPNERAGITEMEEKLKTANFSEILSSNNSQEEKIKVYLPRFKLEESVDLVETFQKMGLKDLFNDKDCNLSGITEEKNVYVSNILHKAFLEVNEDGSEAAAATGMVMMTRSFRTPTGPPPFIVDHPFMFFIRDETSNLVLFSGKVVKF